MDSLRGHLLLATPAIAGGVFWRSVVFLLDHDEAGALGVIVNRPTTARVGEVLPEWAEITGDPGCLFEGGPVATDAALAVAVASDAGVPVVGWQPMVGRVGLVSLDGTPPSLGTVSGVRVFAGYAGWGAGQLEGEIAEGSWLVTEAQDSDVITAEPDDLWRAVLLRQDGDLRLWASLPEDPTLN